MKDEVQLFLDLLVEGFPAVETMDPLEVRALVAERVRPWPDPAPLVATEDRELDVLGGRIGARIYRPRRAAPLLPGVVFLHGGGFVMCSIDSHDGFSREMAAQLGAVVVSVDYRLAPEHRAPVAAMDALAGYRWVAENAAELGIDPVRIAVAGDSAGGNLAAVVAQQAAKDAVPPCAQVLLYPVLDPTCDTPSHHTYATGHYNTRAAMQWYWRQYLGGGDLPDPPELVAPQAASSLAGLPPAVVVTAGRDPLADEGTRYAVALERSGVLARHRHYPDLFHGFLTIAALGAAMSARRLLWQDLEPLLSPAPRSTRSPA